MIEYVLRFIDRDETRLADHGGHEVGDAITVGDYDWIVESISVPEGAPSARIALRLVSPTRDRIARAGDDQTLLAELIERVNNSRDGFNVVMPVGEWIDAQLWPASERAARGGGMTERSAWHSPRAKVHHDNKSCTTSRRIKLRDLRSGSGGRPLCPNCTRLNNQPGSNGVRRA